MRKGDSATMGGPERAGIGQSFDGDRGERAALKFLDNAHLGNEREPDLQLHETLDGFHGSEFKGDV